MKICAHKNFTPVGRRTGIQFALLLGVLLLSTLGRTWADEEAATPYRPTISNPADLPLPGHLELEAGWQDNRGGSDKQRSGAPWLLKYAFTERVGILVGGESALTVTDVANNTARLDSRVVLDLGHAWGLNNASIDTSVFAGVTLLFK